MAGAGRRVTIQPQQYALQPTLELEAEANHWIHGKSLRIRECHVDEARYYISCWHSVLPYVPRHNAIRTCFVAVDNASNDIVIAALWSLPVAMYLNGKGYYELRRMAGSPAVKANQSSEMMRLMRRHLEKKYPWIKCFLSYQAVQSHNGTIYKADNWIPMWKTRHCPWICKNRDRVSDQVISDKIAWGYHTDRKIHANCLKEGKKTEWLEQTNE